jgi:hypothetical protein
MREEEGLHRVGHSQRRRGLFNGRQRNPRSIFV